MCSSHCHGLFPVKRKNNDLDVHLFGEIGILLEIQPTLRVCALVPYFGRRRSAGLKPSDAVM